MSALNWSELTEEAQDCMREAHVWATRLAVSLDAIAEDDNAWMVGQLRVIDAILMADNQFPNPGIASAEYVCPVNETASDLDLAFAARDKLRWALVHLIQSQDPLDLPKREAMSALKVAFDLMEGVYNCLLRIKAAEEQCPLPKS